MSNVSRVIGLEFKLISSKSLCVDILGLWFLSWTFQLSIRANGLNSGHNPITPKSIKMHQPSEGAKRSDAYWPEHLVKDKTLRFF